MKPLTLIAILFCLCSCKAGKEIEDLNFGPGPQDERCEEALFEN